MLNTKLAIQCAKSIACLYDQLVLPNVMSGETDTEALIEEHHNGKWAVIFPGTTSGRDWITDFKFRREPWYPFNPNPNLNRNLNRNLNLSQTGSVHRGFQHAYKSVEHILIGRIPAGAQLILAGHSLGGALATLAASALDGHFNIENVFTFGSPRVGNRRFVADYSQRLGSRTARIMNEHDPVPFVPPWLFGNRHVPTEVYLTEDGSMKMARNIETIAVDRIAAMAQHFEEKDDRQLASIAAHSIHEYIERLEACA